MVRGLRRRYHDRFSDYFSPEQPEALQRGDRRPLLRDRARRDPVKRGLRAASVFRRLAGGAGRDRGRRRDRLGRRATRSPASSSEAATEKIKGPEGTEVTVGRRAPPGRARSAEVRADPRGDRAAGRHQQGQDGRRAQARLRAPGRPSATASTPLRRGVRKGRAEGGAGDRARPARQRRRPARGGGAERERLPAEGRSRGHDRLPHPGPRRLQGRRRQPARACRSSS